MADKFILAEDSAFFVKTIDVPSGLSDSDARDFLSVWIENSSPMPVEKLRFGFVRNAEKATLFAGLDERVYAGFEGNNIATADHFLPALALLLLCGFEDGAYFFKSGKSISRVVISGGLIDEYASMQMSENLSEDIKSLRASSVGGERFIAISNITLASRVKVEFFEFDEDSFVKGNTESAKVIDKFLQKKQLVSADVRNLEIMRKMAKKRRSAELRALMYKAVPLVFILLFISQIFLWIKGAKKNTLEAEYTAIAPHAKQIESESERLAELKMFSEKQLHSISALALVNEARPVEIRFLRSQQTSPFDLQIQGTAPTIGQVHEFVNALQNLDSVKSVEQKTETSRGSARFNLDIKLK